MRRFAGIGTVVFVLVASAQAVSAQNAFAGKTLVARYDVTQTYCWSPGVECKTTGMPIDVNVYFSRNGEVFDYNASGRTGARKTLGERNTGQSNDRWEVKGNRAILTIYDPVITDVYTVTAAGPRCSLAISRRLKPGLPGRLTTVLDVRDCRIVDGHRER